MPITISHLGAYITNVHAHTHKVMHARTHTHTHTHTHTKKTSPTKPTSHHASVYAATKATPLIVTSLTMSQLCSYEFYKIAALFVEADFTL